VISAATASPGTVYRPTKASGIERYRGYSILVPLPPKEATGVVDKLRAGKADSRETWLLGMLREGASLFWRYIRKERATTRELVALPPDYHLREVSPPAWLPKSRKGEAR